MPLLGLSTGLQKTPPPFPHESPRQSRPLALSEPDFHLYGLEDPLPKVTNFGIDPWLLGQGATGAPAHDATQPPTWRPRDVVLTHEGATTVALVGEGEALLRPSQMAMGCGHSPLALR